MHSLWTEVAKEGGSPAPVEVAAIEMSPGLAGSYTFKAKARNGTKSYLHHGQFNKAVISDNRISFFVTRVVRINGKSRKSSNEPILVIDFDEGEISRLLSEDRWFKSETWFKVVVEDLQLSIF
jgi:hypothetical protein